MEESNLEFYVRNSVEPLIEHVKTAETIQYNERVDKKEFRQAWMKKKKALIKNKRRYGQFVREMPKTRDEKYTRNWFRKADKLCAAQEQPIRTNYGDYFVECMTRK